MSAGRDQPCRFGWTCQRFDCWYSHPEGRQIDFTPADYSGPTVCLYGRRCTKPGCRFFHPEGRDMDKGSSSGSSSSSSTSGSSGGSGDQKETERLWSIAASCSCCKGNPFGCSDPTCQSLGICGCLYGQMDHDTESPPPSDDDDDSPPVDPADDDTWKDEWFSKSRECSCCEGYVFKCKKKNPTCNQGHCFCHEETKKSEQGLTTPSSGGGGGGGDTRSGESSHSNNSSGPSSTETGSKGEVQNEKTIKIPEKQADEGTIQTQGEKENPASPSSPTSPTEEGKKKGKKVKGKVKKPKKKKAAKDESVE